MIEVTIDTEVIQAVDIELSLETGASSDPTLQATWDGSTDPQKDTFVDANDAEILTFIDDQLIVLSTEASAAVINIESNGGALTDKEKYFVAKWVDRVQAKGDWATRDILVYAGFANQSCALTNWKTGTLMTISGTVTHDGENWIKGASGYIDTGFDPSSASNLIQNDAIYGCYLGDKLESAAFLFGVYDGSSYAGIDRRGTKWHTGRCNSTAATAISTGIFTSFFHPGKTLYTVSRQNSTNQSLGINGSIDDTEVDASSGVPNGRNIYLLAQNLNGSVTSQMPNGSKLSMFFAGAAVGFDEADFYEGFEDFRTSLHPEILYNITPPTGQVSSARDGDDAWIEENLYAHYRRAQSFMKGTRPIADPADFTKLLTLNAFGTYDKFTDINGLTVFGDDYVINHYTGDGIYNSQLTSTTWNLQIDNALASTQGGYDDWFIANARQGFSLFDLGDATPPKYPPMLTALTSTSGHYTSTTLSELPENASITLRTGTISSTAKTNTRYSLMTRKHY